MVTVLPRQSNWKQTIHTEYIFEPLKEISKSKQKYVLVLIWAFHRNINSKDKREKVSEAWQVWVKSKSVS